MNDNGPLVPVLVTPYEAECDLCTKGKERVREIVIAKDLLTLCKGCEAAYVEYCRKMGYEP